MHSYRLVLLIDLTVVRVFANPICMKIDQVNLNNLRVFECVYRQGCMTAAAQSLHLTQSGISQHIKALENSLQTPLFDRVNRKVIPTEAGHTLYNKAWPALLEIEQVVQGLSSAQDNIVGTIKVGMPIEFGNNLVVPILSKLGVKYPDIQFQLKLDYATNLAEDLINGVLDFVFVDDYRFDKRVYVQEVVTEELLLCGTREYLARFGEIKYSKAFFEQFDFIAYQNTAPILRRWCSHHLKRKNVKLNVRAQIMDVQGVSRFILGGLGLGVLPDHLLSKLVKRHKELVVLPGREKPLTNSISLAYLQGRTQGANVSVVLKELLKSL